MNPTTEEVLIITLAIVMLIATYITLTPSITGLVIQEPTFTSNDNILVGETIQLKQHNLTETSTNETVYYLLTFAEKNGGDKMTEISELDSKFVELDTPDIFKIKFNNDLQDQDKLNLFLSRDEQRTMYVCDFNAEASCENQTIYATLNYLGVEGHYQVTLDLPASTNQMAIYSADGKLKFDYINASHLETTEDITYYYNSDSIESEIIEPDNLSKWDLFTSNYTLNNQTINFYYKSDQDYTEFTPPYNFSNINSSTLQFKLALNSDNSSTPIINNLIINYIEEITPPCQENYTCTEWGECSNETQNRTCIDQNECETQETKPIEEQNCTVENNETEQSSPPPGSSSSGGSPSSTRYSSKTTTTTQTETPVTQTVSVPIILKAAPETQIQEPKKSNMRIIGNAVALSYLAFMCLLLYKRRHNL